MKAKVTSINNEPVKEEPVINPVPKETESKSGEEQLILKGSHSTWEKPTKEEMKQLNAAMAWKFIRLLLQSLAVFVSLSLMAFLRELRPAAFCSSQYRVNWYINVRYLLS